MTQTVRWGVVGTMDEPAPLILAWVAHYLHLGAAEVHVFLDRPVPEAARALAPLPGVFVIECDAAYWAASARGRRPDRHTGRQKYNATAVYRARPLDWLLHCDADEFLHVSGDFEAELAASGARSIRLPNIERVRRGPAATLFEGTFRAPCTDAALIGRVYGGWARCLKDGLSGYRQGKDIVRTGQALTMGIHFPIDAATGRPCAHPQQTSRAARLMHFDGLTPLHVITKLLKRAYEPDYVAPRRHGDQRVAQFTFARDNAAKPGQLRRLLDRVFSLDDAAATALGAAHLDIGFEPGPALDALGLAPDLSVAGFDAALRDREAELVRRAGLRL